MSSRSVVFFRVFTLSAEDRENRGFSAESVIWVDPAAGSSAATPLVSTIVEHFNPGQVRELVKASIEQRETIIKTAVSKAKLAGPRMTAKDISEAEKPQLPAATATPKAVEMQGALTLTNRTPTKTNIQQWPRAIHAEWRRGGDSNPRKD
jgi:hypothetical protein